MTFPSNAEVSVWYCHDLSASHHHNIRVSSWILSGILVWGNHLHLVHEETWPWKNLKEGCYPAAPLSTLTVTLSMPLWCGSCSCNTGEDLGFALWICVIAYADHRLQPGNGRKWLFKEFSTIWMVLKGGSMEVSSMLSMEVCIFLHGGHLCFLHGGHLNGLERRLTPCCRHFWSPGCC